MGPDEKQGTKATEERSAWGWLVGGALSLSVVMAILAWGNHRLEQDARAEGEARQRRQAEARKMAEEAEVEAFRQRAAADTKVRKAKDAWAGHDNLPEAKRTREDLAATLLAALEAVNADPKTDFDTALREQQKAAYRYRVAKRIRPESRAIGERREILEPSGERAPCLLWGSMWANNNADDLRSIGFERIVCAAPKDCKRDCEPRVWNLRE